MIRPFPSKTYLPMVEKIFYLLYILLGVPLAVVCFSSLFAGKGPKTPVENEDGGGVDYSTMLSVFVECRREWVSQKRGGGVYLTAVVDALRNGVAVPIPVAAMALEETRREAQRNAGGYPVDYSALEWAADYLMGLCE